LSDFTLNNVPAGTADGATDLTWKTQASLGRAIDSSTGTLKRQLDEIQTRHDEELAIKEANEVFGQTKASMDRVHKMAKDGFIDRYSLRLRSEAAQAAGGASKSSAPTASTEEQEEQLEQSSQDGQAKELAMRQAKFAEKQRELAVQKEMDASARNADVVEQVAKKLFGIKQEPPPVAPPPDAVLPVDYVPHSQKLAYLEAHLHRSYAAFLSGTHRATLQLERLSQAAKRRTAMIQNTKAELQAEYTKLEQLADSEVWDVKKKALKMAEALYVQLQQVQAAEDEAIASEEKQTQERDQLHAKLTKAKTMVALASGEPPVFNEAEREQAARNKKVADMMNKLNEAANGVVTDDAKGAFSRAIARQP
jgi:hypothetical protein